MNLSIKDVPDGLAQRLRARALRNHRSLQGELMAIVERAVAEESLSDFVKQDTIAERVTSEVPFRVTHHGWKTIEQLMAERKASGWKPDPKMAKLPRGVDLVRADRDSR